ncbi:MAG: archease [Deltaproteobacteria bacterium]|nr:MAG: archease [Deltaproteobacteria bacterium]
MSSGTYEFVDSVTSDLSFVARGPSLEAVFEAAGDAVAAATVESLASIEARTTRSLRLHDTDLEVLLLRFVNELIYLRDAKGLLLRAQRVRIERNGEIELAAELVGERLDPARHTLASEVKAATAHGLRVARVGDGWEASVTLDV